jgi:GNAT superfamily N-acetyltransferase
MLRKAKRADVVEIHRIRMSVHENRLVSRIITEDETIEAIEETGRGWVIEENGEIVGFGVANRQNRNIWALFVHPDHERRGYGRQLLDTMTDWLWEHGQEPIWLSTDPGTRAEGFYRSAGWKITDTLPSGEVRFEMRAPGAGICR